MLSTIHTHIILFEPTEQLTLVADREKIAQVIQNLVGNAVKYSAMGTRITVAYQRTEDNKVQFLVSDEGIEISSEDQEKIFERYHRVQNPKTGSIAGFGIGLYLCREIIELHQGLISVQSGKGMGTTFIVELPLGS